MSDPTGFLGPMLVNVARLTLWLAVLALLFAPVERLFALRRRETPRAVVTDLAYFYLNGILPALLLAAPLSLLAELARAATPAGYAQAIADLPFMAKLVAGLIVSELGSYWAHRWCHSSPFLWRFHAIHHSVEYLDWLANTRAHPVDVVFVRLCGLAPLYMLGLANPAAQGAEVMIPVYVTLAGTVWSFLVHANVRWRFGWLEQLISTPAFHHWHHTNDRENRDRNFAALLPVVDRLFGTLHLPRSWPTCYGIDDEVGDTLRDQLAHPLAPARPESGTRTTAA